VSDDLNEGLSWIRVDPRVTLRGLSLPECLSLRVRLWPDVGATNVIVSKNDNGPQDDDVFKLTIAEKKGGPEFLGGTVTSINRLIVLNVTVRAIVRNMAIYTTSVTSSHGAVSAYVALEKE
jgi:hypothetical protein